ncbi:uncharacterized protein [Zea mays]|uniref:Uncharacterized protein n=1 Tax=Zea mays TaxID=4577 RepID=A0A804MJ70_MAIZE|nr:uncharacterized protein LOC103646907 [Zea mays]|eukprot:XP_008669750.1 uncharacterized protein LOC103646907 [Zea mays]
MPSVSNAQTSIADVALLGSNQLPFLLLCPADAPPSIFLSAATLPWLCPCFLGELAPAPTSDMPSPSRPAPPSPWFPPCSDQVCQVRPFCSPRPPHASTRAPPPVPPPLHRRPGRCRAPSPSRWRGQASRYQNSWIPNLRRMLMLTITACTQRRTFYRKTGRDEKEVLKAIDYVHELSMRCPGQSECSTLPKTLGSCVVFSGSVPLSKSFAQKVSSEARKVITQRYMCLCLELDLLTLI